MIQVARPLLGKAELDSVDRVLKTGWLGMGDKVFQFETKLKEMFKRKHAICVNTGTTALHLALDAIGLKKGDEVIVPSFTFVATVQPIVMCGGIPRFCDIRTEDLNMDVRHAGKLISKKTKAIIPVHYGGAPCNMSEILKLAKKHRLRVIEDAAHAFGSRYNGRLIGSFGDITCFSFDPIKTITCGEGGAILLDDRGLSETVTKKRMLGIDKDTWSRYKHKRSWFYEVHMKGYRYHMGNMNAAIGIAQLAKFKKFAKKRKQIAKFYDDKLSNLGAVRIIKRNYSSITPFNYTILAEERDRLMEFLNGKGIITAINYIPNHLQPFFKRNKASLPNTESVYEKILSIPLHAALRLRDAEFVAETIKDFYRKKI
ncbi:MAG: DegT/DnrJ/EryC1/StrS family aminotransferase [Omnitrophica bacterium]|nr:DegT/DnrJ/EryC1/StrS family aminotransferase [Candidatus Omnitrophota bacterium]